MERRGSSIGKVLSYNKKASFNYTISDTFEAGLSLLGTEVKSARNGGINISDGYVGFDGDGMVLMNVYIAPYKFAAKGGEDYDPNRNRRILMHKRQIDSMAGKIRAAGKAVIPLKVYISRGQRIKVELGIGTGKKLYDKREHIKERDLKRASRDKSFADD